MNPRYSPSNSPTILLQDWEADWGRFGFHRDLDVSPSIPFSTKVKSGLVSLLDTDRKPEREMRFTAGLEDMNTQSDLSLFLGLAEI